MIDPFAMSFGGIAGGSYGAVPLALAAGLLSSVGPCVAPRYLALAALAGGRRAGLPIVAFIAGLVLAYVALGFGTGMVAALAANTSLIDAALGIALVTSGLVALLREPHVCPSPSRDRDRRTTATGAFTLGAASVLVISPCCTPLLAAVAGLSLTERDPLLAAAYLGAFALGHAAPLGLAGVTGRSFARRFRTLAASSAVAVVGATLTIALGCYYGLLA